MVIRTPKVVIFDMDGTLIDNYSYHIEAWYVICKKYNAPKSKKYIITHLHGTNHEVCKKFFGSEISAEQSAKIGLDAAKNAEEYVVDNAIMDVGIAAAPETMGLSLLVAGAATVLHNLAVDSIVNVAKSTVSKIKHFFKKLF